MIIPGTTKDIIEVLIQEYGFSVKNLAQELRITPKTIYQILKGKKPHPKIEVQIVALYLRIKLTGRKKNLLNFYSSKNLISSQSLKHKNSSLNTV